MLMDSETAKLKERDEKYNEQVMEWRRSLGPRKKVCKVRYDFLRAITETFVSMFYRFWRKSLPVRREISSYFMHEINTLRNLHYFIKNLSLMVLICIKQHQVMMHLHIDFI